MKIAFVFILNLFIFLGCSNSSNNSLEKENELLKRENDVLRQEKELENKRADLNKIANFNPKEEALRQFDLYSPKIRESKGAEIGNSEAFLGDLNNDGFQDVAIYFVLTPQGGGNALVGQGMAVYFNKGDKMKVVAGFEPEYIFTVEGIEKGKIHIKKLEYADNDDIGRPSIETHKYLIVNGNRLTESSVYD